MCECVTCTPSWTGLTAGLAFVLTFVLTTGLAVVLAFVLTAGLAVVLAATCDWGEGRWVASLPLGTVNQVWGSMRKSENLCVSVRVCHLHPLLDRADCRVGLRADLRADRRVGRRAGLRADRRVGRRAGRHLRWGRGDGLPLYLWAKSTKCG